MTISAAMMRSNRKLSRLVVRYDWMVCIARWVRPNSWWRSVQQPLRFVARCDGACEASRGIRARARPYLRLATSLEHDESERLQRGHQAWPRLCRAKLDMGDADALDAFLPARPGRIGICFVREHVHARVVEPGHQRFRRCQRRV